MHKYPYAKSQAAEALYSDSLSHLDRFLAATEAVLSTSTPVDGCSPRGSLGE